MCHPRCCATDTHSYQTIRISVCLGSPQSAVDAIRIPMPLMCEWGPALSYHLPHCEQNSQSESKGGTGGNPWSPGWRKRHSSHLNTLCQSTVLLSQHRHKDPSTTTPPQNPVCQWRCAHSKPKSTELERLCSPLAQQILCEALS